jgi:lipoprotein-anchoring transpeptidase ErfK/SrfK
MGDGAALGQFVGAPPPEDPDVYERGYPREEEAPAYNGGVLGPVVRPDAPRRAPRMADVPPDSDPDYSRPQNRDDEVDFSAATRTTVDDPTGRPAGTITIDTNERKLYLSIGGGQAYQYDVGVGREGFDWKGTAQIGRKAYWPAWTPPREMLIRRPEIPRHVEGGVDSPLGARALYLFRGDKDTMFRIHGTNEPDTIGYAVSSGCIRMMNADVIDLYNRVPKGARVVVF